MMSKYVILLAEHFNYHTSYWTVTLYILPFEAYYITNMLIMRECIGQILSKRSEIVGTECVSMSPCYKIVIELSEWELVPAALLPIRIVL